MMIPGLRQFSMCYQRDRDFAVSTRASLVPNSRQSVQMHDLLWRPCARLSSAHSWDPRAPRQTCM